MEATADKDLDALNLHLQKASEMGITGREVESAKAVQKELLISHASLKALRLVVKPSLLRFVASGDHYTSKTRILRGSYRIDRNGSTYGLKIMHDTKCQHF